MYRILQSTQESLYRCLYGEYPDLCIIPSKSAFPHVAVAFAFTVRNYSCGCSAGFQPASSLLPKGNHKDVIQLYDFIIPCFLENAM